MTIYNTMISIQNLGSQKINFNYSYNEKTTFRDLLEFVSSLLIGYGICHCCSFEQSKKSFNNTDIIATSIKKFTTIKLNIFRNNPCNCSPLDKRYSKLSKYAILEKYQYDLDNILQLIKIKEEQIKKINEDKKLKEKENKKIDEIQKPLNIPINGDLGVKGDNLKQKSNILQIDENSNQIKGDKLESEKIDFKDFYDIIVDIKSVKDINKGWKIKMKKEGYENYNKFKNEEILKIGVIGNYNKGKSFLLSKISKINLPSGTSIRTEGLSVKYPQLEGFENRRIVLLDSAGLETPVLKDEEYENKEITKEDKQQDDDEKKIIEREYFKEKSREKLITEFFLQRYIINNSDILIIVVGIISYSEQKLLNRIKKEIQRAKIRKPLYIIHNLMTYTTIKQVEEYIDNILFKSATFDLKKGHGVSTKMNQKSETYYFEKNNENQIYHLIFANEGSEAGEYYNNNTLSFLEKTYTNVTEIKPFDVIKSLKESFIEISKEIIEKSDNPLDLSDFCDEYNDNKLESIKLTKEKNITLKRCLIDELGFSNLNSNGFEPNYNFYKEIKDNIEKIIIRLEVPGNYSIESNVVYNEELTIIKLKGNKRKDKFPEKLEDNIFNSREFGPFNIDIPLKTEEYLIKNSSPTVSDKKGILMIEYLLENKVTDTKSYKINEEDEV